MLTRFVMAIVTVLCLALVLPSGQVLAQGNSGGKGGGKPDKDPPNQCPVEVTPTPFPFNDPILLLPPPFDGGPLPLPTNDPMFLERWFGQQVAGAQVTDSLIVFAVADRPPNQVQGRGAWQGEGAVFFYTLDDSGSTPLVTPVYSLALEDQDLLPYTYKLLKAANFNDDGVPDFIAARQHGLIVDVYLSTGLTWMKVPIPVPSGVADFADSLAVGNIDGHDLIDGDDLDEFAVGGVAGGDVFIYDVSLPGPVIVKSQTVSSSVGGDFGQRVAFAEIDSNSPGLELVVAAPRLKVGKNRGAGGVFVFGQNGADPPPIRVHDVHADR